jgi:A/G-specific adenine glycosylase
VTAAAGLPAQRVRRALLDWYDRTGRRLAFRDTADPYAVLVSEIMAQQTQIGRVEPAWRAFLVRFPSFSSLAAASGGDVLRAWAGLGYNRRALNLQRAARAVLERHGGQLPDEPAALETLPGVGPYTARAVAAISFGRAVGAVDTNVRRVLGRVAVGHGHPADGGQALGTRELQALADRLVDPDRPADWTHALMDLGATICRPRPTCHDCPLRARCAYAATPSAERAAPVRRGPPAAAPRFATTSRWLRGRLLAALRDRPPGEWSVLAAMGTHGPDSVEAALAQLAREGLVERDRTGRVRLPA